MPNHPRAQSVLTLVLIAVAMAAIFVADTTTSLEVAAAVFYTAVILTASRALGRRALIVLCALCIGMTVVSFGLTPHGAHEAGLINMSISIAAIIITAYLVLKMASAREAAHEAQAQLMRIARVQSLEGLTTSIAHEVNQPLAAIVTSGNACQRWLAQQPPNVDKARQALERILADAGRASSIIARVRSLTRGEPPQRGAFGFNAALLEIIALSQAEIDRNGIRLTTRFPADLPCAWADRIQIQQVVANLVLNAIEAMAAAPAHARTLQIASRLEDGALVGSVADSGAGIASGMHEHVFDAFWTTKEQGVGVGLSISRAIIEANGGRIWAQPNHPGGAMFQFSVPVAPGEST
ncbi:sensor histidine kinase [Castellaniella sp.]|uniref:sensor histidine kinase n=1 Tax=Castellaniella sp. TaxID=1955812 RepID=UPI003C78C26C